MELGTGLAVLGASQLVVKLLGPTADYIGGGLKAWSTRRVENVNRIFSAAIRKTGPAIDSEGSVPPKVLKGILDEGSFCDDELTADYFGGVLASSRSTVSRDDRGATFLALLSRLSTYQIRTHYIFYSGINGVFAGSGLRLDARGRSDMQLFLSNEEYIAAMDLSDKELDQFNALCEHIFFGLGRERLLDEGFMYGDMEYLRKRHPQIDAEIAPNGIICGPSVLGAELFLWAHGAGRSDGVDVLVDPDHSFEPCMKIDPPMTYVPLKVPEAEGSRDK